MEEDLLLINDKKKLVSAVSMLINHDFAKLVQLLYRIDVSEKKLREALDENKDKDSAEIIAELIIERQLQKIKTRKENQGNKEIDENEKW